MYYYLRQHTTFVLYDQGELCAGRQGSVGTVRDRVDWLCARSLKPAFCNH